MVLCAVVELEDATGLMDAALTGRDALRWDDGWLAGAFSEASCRTTMVQYRAFMLMCCHLVLSWLILCCAVLSPRFFSGMLPAGADLRAPGSQTRMQEVLDALQGQMAEQVSVCAAVGVPACWDDQG